MKENSETIIAFIGGGNMAGAIIGGLVAQGHAASAIQVVEPSAEARRNLLDKYKVQAQAEAGPWLREAALVVWAVKPQIFKETAKPLRLLTQQALHLSVAAGIESGAIGKWLETERIVRAMPNTPALIGAGISGLYAPPGTAARDADIARAVLASTGRVVTVDHEALIDTVTAVSGSGPAYAFYLMEAMIEAGIAGGLDAATARELAIHTVKGAALLAIGSEDPPEVLRARVTSPGGTTAAAIGVLEERQVGAILRSAIGAAAARSRQLSIDAASSWEASQ